MKHRKSGRKLSRTSSHRQMMLRNMVTALLDHEKIQTTLAKAKEVKRLTERVIDLGKKGDLHARRSASAILTDRGVVKKLFTDIAPRFQDRSGGFTRIVRVGIRAGDAAPMSVVTLAESEAPTTPKKKTDKGGTKKAKTVRRKTRSKVEKGEVKKPGKKVKKAEEAGAQDDLPKEKTSGRKRAPRKKRRPKENLDSSETT